MCMEETDGISNKNKGTMYALNKNDNTMYALNFTIIDTHRSCNLQKEHAI